MSMPKLNDNQFLALALLEFNPFRIKSQLGDTLRSRIYNRGCKISGPGFYQLMAGLQKRGMVSSKFVRAPGTDRPVRMKQYRILAKGRRALADKLAFYAQFMENGKP